MNRSLFGKDFTFASTAYFFVFLSASIFYLFPLYLNQFHPSKSMVGLIMGIHSMTAIMVRPLFGRLLDKRGGRKVAMGGLLIMIASLPGFYLIGSAGALAIALRALNGIGWGVSTTALLAICSELSPADRMAQSLGIIGVAGIIASAAGPMLAEEVLHRSNFHVVFSVSLAALIIAAIFVFAVKAAPPGRPSDRIKQSGHMSAYPMLILLIIAAMPIVHGAVRGAVLNFIALFGAGLGFSRVGPFFLAFSIAAVITRLGIGDVSDRYGRKRVIIPSAFLISLNLLWIAGIHNYWAFILSGFVAGLGQGLIFPALSTYVIDFLGHENKGLALGLYLSLFDVGMGIGSPIFGWISDAAGYRTMYIVAGCLSVALTVVFSLKAPVFPSLEHAKEVPPDRA
ncbi:MAG TPA: MFS transporter [Acidobacteriota bacterium]|nr:MFS transporter [Acidobacteriota bacterium]